MKLFGELVDTFHGPIIVIGGGPSAIASLEELKAAGVEPAAVISANEHGHRQSIYPVTHSVCCDGIHGEKRIPMERLLKELGPQAAILTPGHFGDVRLPDWSLAANSGLTAVACAVMMGGAPVIVVGIDFYRQTDRAAGTYFHDAKATSNSNAKVKRNFDAQISALVQWVGLSAPIRPMFGRLLETWPRWRADELVERSVLVPRAKYMRSLPTCIVQARPHPPYSFKVMRVEPGRVFPMSPNEARGAINGRSVKLIETRPAPDGSPLKLPASLMREPVGYRPGRLVALKRNRGER